jgi:hypothetical protein
VIANRRVISVPFWGDANQPVVIVDELTRLGFTANLAETELRHLAQGRSVFETATGARISLDDPCLSGLVRRMLDAQPKPVSFADLEGWAAEHGHTPADLTRSLLLLIGKGWVDPRLPIGCV